MKTCLLKYSLRHHYRLFMLYPDTSNLSLLNYQGVKRNSRLLQRVVRIKQNGNY
jgi:hypothetical protein